MARRRDFGERAFELGLVHRLVDEHAGSTRGVISNKSPARKERDYLAGLRIDLENLLNTRRPCSTPQFSDGDLLERSLFNYGIPDPAGLNMSDHEARERFVKAVRRTIELFEPRLIVYDVHEATDEKVSRGFRVRIRAALKSNPNARIYYDSLMRPGSSHITINEVAP